MQANLVSEIPTLRRELKPKIALYIEDLENNIQSTGNEEAEICEGLQNSDKE